MGTTMTQVEWVVFDKDGTIIEMDALWIEWAKNLYDNLTENSDFETHFSLQTFLKNIGVNNDGTTIDPTSPLAIGSIQEAETIMAYLLYQQGISWSKGVTLARIASNLATSQQENSKVQALPGIRSLLITLKNKGMKLGVITADQTARAKSHLQQLELLTLFEFVLGSDQAVYSKPFPDLAYVAKEQFQIPLERTVMIGDSNADMLFAKNAGMCFSIGIIPTAMYPKDYLPDATKIIDAYDESVITMLCEKE